MTDAPKPPLDLLIAAPRGFCAGVDRAIRIVELALEKHGAPVYVRHEIVHNKFVVDSLKAKGAIFAVVPSLSASKAECTAALHYLPLNDSPPRAVRHMTWPVVATLIRVGEAVEVNGLLLEAARRSIRSCAHADRSSAAPAATAALAGSPIEDRADSAPEQIEAKQHEFA